MLGLRSGNATGIPSVKADGAPASSRLTGSPAQSRLKTGAPASNAGIGLASLIVGVRF